MSLPGNITFAYPWALALLALLPLLALAYRALRPARPRVGVRLSTIMPLDAARPGPRVRLRPVLAALRLLALALLVVAVARPRTVEAGATITSEGIDIVLALDISGSMREPGLDSPTKIDAAKKALKQFLESRRDDRVGFVVFKSESRVMSPLTTDYKALQTEVDQAEQLNEQLAEGTAIGLGMADAIGLLRESTARSRVLILATDGQNNSGKVTPEQAALLAEALKIRAYTIGLVTANARAEQTLDERQMRAIAETTGGSYARATNQQALLDIFTEIATLEKDRKSVV